MNYPKTKRTLMSLAVAGTFTSIVVPGYAEDASTVVAQADTAQTSTTAGAVNTPEANASTVVVTGIRKSLQSSMNLKRNSSGIVDGIVAEDIGKFPDTNLAESLQRISGVSIDRVNGEGSKVTVRGVGPDFNLVLLNGRQMPTSGFEGLQPPRGRSFDFANLASEAISQMQVYKSSRAETPTGGIGATINVMTARPLDNPGVHASVGIKAVYDSAFSNLPADVKNGANTITPEASGIYSQTFHDNMFGIAISASSQTRHGGYNQADTGGYFSYQKAVSPDDWGTLPATGPGQVNYPADGAVYSVPISIGYDMHSVERKRTNSQLVLQFAPVKELRTTLDYTWALNKVADRSASLGAWFGGYPEAATEWTQGNPVSPKIFERTYGSPTDLSVAGSLVAAKTELKSVGFNTTWKASDNLKLEFDAHDSKSDTTPDSPYGYNNSLGVASFSRIHDKVDYSHDLPTLHTDNVDYDNFTPRVTGSSFRNGEQHSTVTQYQTKGNWKFTEESSLDFGLAITNYENQSAYRDNQNGTWSETGASADHVYDPFTFHKDDLRQYFSHISGHDDPNWTTQYVTFNFEDLDKQISGKTGRPDLYVVAPLDDTAATARLHSSEKSKSFYTQYNADWDLAVPLHTVVGVRYEKTDVSTPADLQTPDLYVWRAQNEYDVTPGTTVHTTATGSYNYTLPTLDVDADIASNMKLRAAYSENIGRAGWNDIQGGRIISTFGRQGGGTGSQGNPALKPVKSKNVDLSYEWYYAKQSYFSVGYFKKSLTDFTGHEKVDVQFPNTHTPVGGALWNDAIANSGCVSNDMTCLRNWIFANRASSPGVDAVNQRITGQPGDPVANFQVDTPLNVHDAGIHGLELNVQHMFGNSGFGIAANYTYVKSDLKFNNLGLDTQFVLPGLSNSGNLTGIYEDANWSVRAAYNWRGEFYSYSGASQYGATNPVYVEPYGQLDLNVGYNVTKQFTVSGEVINLTNAIQRTHTRTWEAFNTVVQTGPRYMLGARYKF